MVHVENYETDMSCVGTLISSKYVVSVAHCVYNNEERRFIPALEIYVNISFSHFNTGISPQSRSKIQWQGITSIWLTTKFTGLQTVLDLPRLLDYRTTLPCWRWRNTSTLRSSPPPVCPGIRVVHSRSTAREGYKISRIVDPPMHKPLIIK